MYPHRIRLRGPWDCEPLSCAHGEPLPAPCRVTMPCLWRDTALAEFNGTIRCRRRFGLPRHIDAHERLWLTFAGVTGNATVEVNGQLLGPHAGPGPFAFEVTAHLRQRNELVVVVDAVADGGLWGEVALEIRCSAYLRGVRVWSSGAGPDARLHAAGEVVGVADRRLDLYLLRDDRTVAYAAVDARPAGQPFQLTSEPLASLEIAAPDEPGAFRVELVNGGSVWYQWFAAAP